MWNNENVERALFKWNKWQSSIIGYWGADTEYFTGLALNKIREKVNNVLIELGFPVCVLFELYWISCVLSDYVIDDRNTYKNIVLSNWLSSLYIDVLSKVYYKIPNGDRVYPPEIWTDKDVAFQGRKVYGGDPPEVILESLRSPNDKEQWIYLPAQHELHKLLNLMKGRPPVHRKPGKYAIYSDRLAVKCAVLKDKHGMTFVEIASQLGLPISRPYISRQSDLARHLVKRGRNWLQSINEH